MKASRGFTLVELMISLAVFALLVTMAYQSVNLLIEANRRVAAPQTEFQQLQRAMVLLERDLHQLVLLRPRNTGFSQDNAKDKAAIMLPRNSGDGVLLEFTRGGNPDLAWQLRSEAFMRSTLQRVRYVYRDKQLLRETWNLIDRVESARPVSNVLFDGIEKAPVFRFMAKRGDRFRTNLPQQPDQLAAIEVVLNHERFGELRRIFIVQP